MSEVHDPVIVRHRVWSGSMVESAWPHREVAILRARTVKSQWPRHKVWIDRYELKPNARVLEFGVQKYDKMLTDVMHDGFELTGSLDDLIACGAIGSYIRDILGKSGCKSSCDEYGNHYTLQKRGKHRYRLRLYFSQEPKVPGSIALRRIGFEARDPDDMDVSGILARITGGAS